MSNATIARLLRDVAAAYTVKNEGKYRFQILAYERAADAIEHAAVEMRDLWKEGRLDTVPGVGPGIAAHLSELFEKGSVSHFEELIKDIPPPVYPLLDIPGFGPKKAYKLVTAFKLKNPTTVIVDLEKQAARHAIAKLPGFGEKSEQDIVRAFSEYKAGSDKSSRMVLPYAYETAERMLAYLRQSKHIIEAHTLGSLRRMVSTIGDIDIAVATKNPKAAIEHFVSYPLTDRVIEKGTATASIFVSGGKHVDLMVQPPESMGSLLQHFTGSKNHNVHLRELALKKGLSLSEYGIKKGSKLRTYDSEEKFYRSLGMDWIPPEIRENTGEIELALAHKLPKLIELKDMKGDLHIHSSYPIQPSHDMGRSSMETMLKKAKALNYDYLSFSEHNPSTGNHTPDEIYRIMAKRKEKIEQLKKSNISVRVINSLETDILPSGHLAIDDKSLSTIDFAVVSIHSVFSMDEIAMTRRVLTGLSHPKAKVLAHPTGRLLNKRVGYTLNWKEVFAFCKQHDKVLEINAWPLRLDLPDVLVREAIAAGVKLSIDTDSHEVSQMDLMRYGVAVARRGWATPEDIVNSWSWTKFAQWFNIEA